MGVLFALGTLMAAPVEAQSTPGRVADPAFVEIPLPIFIESGGHFEADVRITDDFEVVSVAAAPLLEHLRAIVREETLGVISPTGQIESVEGYVTIAALDALGFEPSFDEAALVLHIAVPPEVRITTVHSVGGSAAIAPADTQQPDAFSFAIPVGATLRLSYDRQSRPRFQIDTGPWVNVYGFVLESALAIGITPTPHFAANRVTLSKDFVAPQIRVALGDVQATGRALGTRTSVLGASVGREFSLNPFIRTQPDTRYEVLMAEPGTVAIQINDNRPIETRLLPGPHVFEDFPLDNGPNRIRIEVSGTEDAPDDEPNGTAVRISAPYVSSLLAPGIHEFQVAAGLLNRSFDDPFLSAYHRFGLARILTSGFSIQADNTAASLGIESLLATPIGSFLMDGAVSWRYAGLFGGAARLGYRLSIPWSDFAPSVSLDGEITGAPFLRPGTDESAAAVASRLSLAGSVSQRIATGMSFQVSVSHDRFLSTAPAASTRIGATFSASITQSTSLRLQANAGIAGGQAVWDFSLGITSSGDGGKSNATVSRDIESGTSALSYTGRLSAGQATMNVGLSARGIGEPSGPTGSSLSLEVDHPRYTGSIRHSLVASRPASADIGFDSGLYFTGGLFTIGAPTQGPFVIARSMREDASALTAQTEGAGFARSGGLSTAFLSGITPYRPARVTLALSELPIDAGEAVREFILTPGYKSGTALKMEAVRRVHLRGRAVTADGEPVSLRVGMVEGRDGFALPDEAASTFFSDEDGVFEVYGLGLGRFTLAVPASGAPADPTSADAIVAFVEIASRATGFYDIGEVVFAESSSAEALYVGPTGREAAPNTGESPAPPESAQEPLADEPPAEPTSSSEEEDK